MQGGYAGRGEWILFRFIRHHNAAASLIPSTTRIQCHTSNIYRWLQPMIMHACASVCVYMCCSESVCCCAETNQNMHGSNAGLLTGVARGGRPVYFVREESRWSTTQRWGKGGSGVRWWVCWNRNGFLALVLPCLAVHVCHLCLYVIVSCRLAWLLSAAVCLSLSSPKLLPGVECGNWCNVQQL